MSKAFTKESDHDLPDDVPAPLSLLAAGARNYLTAQGEQRLQGELRRLVKEERPRLLLRKEDEKPDAAAELRRVELRIRDLQQRLAGGEIVHAPANPREVQFGAVVTVREVAGEDLEYRIVGVNEVDLEECWISVGSPLARTLLGHRAGESVAFQAPGGMRRLEILDVSYPGSVLEA